MSYEVDRPVEFSGTDEERDANRATHCWMYDHEEPPRCTYCDAATYHVAADYPCGEEPPRETATFEGEVPSGFAGYYLLRHGGVT